ncbi:unnamed protein product, partial [Closterium sp. NIES-54]
TTLAALGFVPSTADPSLFLRTDTSLPPFYVLVALEELNYKVDEKEIIYIALQGLDQEANEALLQYLHLEQQKWTKAWIWEVLVSDEARKRDAGRGVEGGMGAGDRAASKKYQQRQGGGGKKKELDKCLVPGCNRKHSWKECWSRLDGWKPQGYPGEAPPVTRPEWVERRMKNGAWNKKGSKEKAAASAANEDKKGKEDSSDDGFSFLSLEKETALAGRVLADPNQLILDSGATCGMVPRRDLFTTYHSLPPNSRNVIVGSGDTLQAIGIGTITVKGKEGEVLNLKGVLHVPGLAANLLSCSQLARQEYICTFTMGGCTVRKGGAVVMEAKLEKGLYLVPVCVPHVEKAHGVEAKDAACSTRWRDVEQGVDYFQTFSPTPKMTTLRVLLHVAAHRDYELHSLDFSTAFLQGSLHEEIWLRRPPGFTGTSPPGTQWSLRRPVYGLRQAPREWHDTLRTTLAALGFAPSTADPSLFLRTDTSLPPFYILVYVDDLVFATADTAGLAYVTSELQKRHTCTDLGELRSYLGLEITRDRARRTITLTQSHMVQQVLQRFGFTYSSPQATPLPTRHSLSALPSDESVESSGPYPELVGCLMYLMTCTRPDLAYPLSILARYVAPGRHRPEHMTAAKRVLRYLCSTSGMGLVLGGRSPVVLTGHADASWADDQATQRSSQGYTFSLGSGSVSWRATRSSSVLGSSCEAEIYAGAMAAQELRWLTYLLRDLGELPRSPPVLYVDNKAMLALSREQRLEHRTKHIALRYFLARELQQRGQLRLAYVASEAKALAPCDHQRFCTQLGLVPVLPHLLTS